MESCTIEQGAERVTVAVTIAGAVTPALISEINVACERVEDGARGAYVVLRLRGGIEPANPGAPDIHLLTQWERALRRLERLPATIVAVAEGRCGWTECSALVVADRRIGVGNFRLTLSNGDAGVMPGMVLHRIANQTSSATSRRMALFGHELNATEAVTLGLIDEITADAEDAVAAFMESTKDCDPTNLAVGRQLLLEAPARSYEDALGTHLAACDRMLRRVAMQVS